MQDIVKKEYIENDETLVFMSTPLNKIIILSIVTCGFYLMIITFGYWRELKNNFGYKVSPFWRSLFAGFTNFALFPILDKYTAHFNQKLFKNTTAATLIFFFCNGALGKLSTATAKLDETNWILEGISFILIFILTAIYVIIQKKINTINETCFPNAPKNPWKISNVIWLIVCTLLLFFAYLP